MSVKIKQHKGAWWIFINHQGKRKAKRIGSSKRAAETAAEKIQAKIALGQFAVKDEKTARPFDVHFRHWLDTYVTAHCKERTRSPEKNSACSCGPAKNTSRSPIPSFLSWPVRDSVLVRRLVFNGMISTFTGGSSK